MTSIKEIVYANQYMVNDCLQQAVTFWIMSNEGNCRRKN